MAKKKEPRKRAEKYDEKLAVKGTFEDLLKVAITPGSKPKPAPKQQD